MVRTLASQQCGPGSISGVDTVCGLSLLLAFVLAPRVFVQSSGFFVALISDQCGPGLIPGVDAICGLSLLLVLVLAPRVLL